MLPPYILDSWGLQLFRNSSWRTIIHFKVYFCLQHHQFFPVIRCKLSLLGEHTPIALKCNVSNDSLSHKDTQVIHYWMLRDDATPVSSLTKPSYLLKPLSMPPHFNECLMPSFPALDSPLPLTPNLLAPGAAIFFCSLFSLCTQALSLFISSQTLLSPTKIPGEKTHIAWLAATFELQRPIPQRPLKTTNKFGPRPCTPVLKCDLFIRKLWCTSLPKSTKLLLSVNKDIPQTNNCLFHLFPGQLLRVLVILDEKSRPGGSRRAHPAPGLCRHLVTPHGTALTGNGADRERPCDGAPPARPAPGGGLAAWRARRSLFGARGLRARQAANPPFRGWEASSRAAWWAPIRADPRWCDLPWPLLAFPQHGTQKRVKNPQACQGTAMPETLRHD